jgi:hypothetical protein
MKNRPFHPNRATNVISFVGNNKVVFSHGGSCEGRFSPAGFDTVEIAQRNLFMQPNPVDQFNTGRHFIQFSHAPKKQRKKHYGCCYSYHNHTPSRLTFNTKQPFSSRRCGAIQV